MWYVTHYPSDTRHPPDARYLAFALVAVFAVLLPSLWSFGALITTDRYIVREEEPVTEDQYVTSTSAVVEGVIDGDLTVFTGSLIISGEVTGNVTVFSSGSVTITETGTIGGSVNGAAASVSVFGNVGTDLFIAAGAVVIEEQGTIGRDAISFGGTMRVDGTVERDVRGRSYRTTVDGTVGGDVDIATQSLAVSGAAVIRGDVLYRSSSDAEIAEGAMIGGTVTKLSAQSNFLYGIILAIANVVGFLGFLVAGLIVLWIMRSSGSRAVGVVLTKPFKSLLVGVITVFAFPFLVGLLAITLVGIPVALILIAIGVGGFIVGAVPAVTALGNRVLLNRGGLFGAFLVGAVLWRLSILLPWVGGFLFLLALVWGVGAWVLGGLAARRSDPLPAALLPTSIVARSEAPQDWDAPLAPTTAALLALEPSDGRGSDEGPNSTTTVDPDVSALDDLDTDGPDVSDRVDTASDRLAPPDAAPTATDPPAATDAQGLDEGSTAEPDASIVEGRVTFSDDDIPVDDEEEGSTLSERFEALREELLTTGTVEPVEEPDPSEEPPDGASGESDDWGLPKS
jgi:cytoskeletal protein CcmA (bactofilin family)